MNEFKECTVCAKKSGTPVLCDSCLYNRQIIHDLEDARDYHIEKFEFIRKKYNDLCDSIPELINFAAIDAKSGKDPCIYKRGNLWRYHTQRAANQWHDHEDPATAALLARIKS